MSGSLFNSIKGFATAVGLLWSKSAAAEKEALRLFKALLPGTEFAGKAFAVGGYVRDELLGKDSKDLDVVVEMEDGAEKLARFIKATFPDQVSNPHNLGASYPIWSIAFKGDIELDGVVFHTNGAVIEFADTMTETYPDPNSRQRETKYGTVGQDIERRDFTVNMLLRDLATGELLDLTGVSKNDIQKGILRGHPGVDFAKIITEDPLRMMRLVRFQAKYGWEIPLSVIRTVKKNAARIEVVSAERVMGELQKLAELGKLKRGIQLMKTMGLLEYIFPEVKAMIGVEHDKRHHLEGDVYQHTLKVLENAKPTLEDQLAALLHDVGKPATQELIKDESGGPDKIQFLEHDEVGAFMARAILKRLRLPTAVVESIVSRVEHHMRPHFLNDASTKALRKFVRDVGVEMIDAILDLAEADSLGRIPTVNDVPALRQRLREIVEAPVPVQRKPILNGNEVMQALNIQTNKDKKIIGTVNQYLIELEDEFIDAGKTLTKEEAIRSIQYRFGESNG